MPTIGGCEFKGVCNEEVTHDSFRRNCQSETNQYIYCDTYIHLTRDTKLPGEWDK